MEFFKEFSVPRRPKDSKFVNVSNLDSSRSGMWMQQQQKSKLHISFEGGGKRAQDAFGPPWPPPRLFESSLGMAAAAAG